MADRPTLSPTRVRPGRSPCCGRGRGNGPEGPSTASQTAWGLIGLLAGAEASDPAIQRAVSYLVDEQNADGSWSENEFTGTGFPCVFYLKYHLYRNSFPLYALARFRNQSQETKQFSAMTFQPAEFRLRSGF